MRYCSLAKVVLLSGLALGVIACSTKSAVVDGGRDGSMVRDGIVPPDLGARDGLRGGNVGAPCSTNTGEGCTGQAECLGVTADVGMCAIPDCTMEDLETPAIEDDCPALAAGPSVCTLIQVQSGDGGFKEARYCLPQCSAKATENACAAVNPALTCDPVTMLLNGHAEVCLMAACPAAPCSNDPIKPPTTCDTPSATCQVTGKQDAKIGSPCLVSSDCGQGQFCLPETTDKSGATVLAGGYCTIIGCEHGDSKNPNLWTCPRDSKCFTVGKLSLCLAVGCEWKAQPGQTGCRNDAPTGQYTCTLYKVDGNDVGVCWINVSTQK
jgi:hypothetical protein